MRRIFLILVLAACSKTEQPSRAFKVHSRADLIGGKRALGEVGDFKLSNGLIHAVIQDVGTSRGFGAFGGSLIDVDLVRGNGTGGAQGPVGNDWFTEMFPAFFLTAIEPSKVEVLKDGSDGGPAVIRVSGRAGNFITVAKSLTDLVNPSAPIEYACDYILEPGKQYLKIVVSVTNPGTSNAAWLLTVPFGFVTLLGEGQRLFVPGGAGFDMRFHLEDTVYKRPTAIDAIPGEVTPMWTTSGDGVSYAMVAARPLDGNYLEGKPKYYPTAKPDSLLIPVASSSFLGSFWAKAPTSLAPKATFSYTGYLAVGSGDVASVQKVVYELRDTILRPNGKEFVQRDKVPYGTASGLVRETPTQQPLGGVSVVLQDEAGNYVSQAVTLPNGRWTAPLPPGKYVAYAVDKNRSVVRSPAFVEVSEGSSAELNLELSQPGSVQIVVRDEQGRALPSKISIEAIYDAQTGKLPRQFLYDLKVGERYRQSDLTPDDQADPSSRRYLEKVLQAAHGSAGSLIRPGKYTVYASRGPEYDLQSQVIDVKPGATATVVLTLTHVLDTPNWVSADFHVHSINSVDSDFALRERVASFAIEGVDYMAATDHNYVTDFAPTIDALDLRDWVSSTIGLELTTLEMGHFNAFPIQLQAGPVGHGSFRWFYRPPGELFAQLRGLGRDPAKTVVQVNHPRDTILGYLNAFNYGTYTGAPTEPLSSFDVDQSPQPDGTPSPYAAVNYSGDFDAVEVFNGKRQELIKSYRRPVIAPEGDEPKLPACGAGLPTKDQDCLPAVGEIFERVAEYTDSAGIKRTTLQPAFPGAQDDWFTMLAQGKHVTATGNSDSHTEKAEAGLPRTYLEVGETANGSMRALDPDAVPDAVRAGRAVVTNGPFIDVTVNGQGLGRTVVAPDGSISVKIKVQAAPWVDVKRVVVRRGGRDQKLTPDTLETIPVTTREGVVRLDVTKTYTGIPDDSFIVVEAFGEEAMWPVFTPHEVPSLQISDAIRVLADAFGFGAKFGKYKPDPSQQVTPYAFTNPIFVTRTVKQRLTAAKPVLPLSSSAQFKPRVMPNLLKLFHAFHSDVE